MNIQSLKIYSYMATLSEGRWSTDIINDGSIKLPKTVFRKENQMFLIVSEVILTSIDNGMLIDYI